MRSLLSVMSSGFAKGSGQEGEDFLHGAGEAEEGDDVAGGDVDDPDTALAFAAGLADGDTAEDSSFADLREADEGELAVEFEASGKAGQLGNNLRLSRFEIVGAEATVAGFQIPQMPGVETRGVWHAEAVEHDFAGGDVEDGAAVELVSAPAFRGVRGRVAADVGGHAVAHGEAVEMAAVLGGEGVDERRFPARDEAMVAVEGAEAGEPGIYGPELAIVAPRDFVDADVAGDETGAGRKTASCLTLGSIFSPSCWKLRSAQTSCFVPTAN